MPCTVSHLCGGSCHALSSGMRNPGSSQVARGAAPGSHMKTVNKVGHQAPGRLPGTVHFKLSYADDDKYYYAGENLYTVLTISLAEVCPVVHDSTQCVLHSHVPCPYTNCDPLGGECIGRDHGQIGGDDSDAVGRPSTASASSGLLSGGTAPSPSSVPMPAAARCALSPPP